MQEHDKSASWQNLIGALDTYISLCNQSKWDEADDQWSRGVGSAQALLPVHVVNEYCHPNRSFSPCPNFKDTTPIPRSRETREGEWFSSQSDDSVAMEGQMRWKSQQAEAHQGGVMSRACGIDPTFRTSRS